MSYVYVASPYSHSDKDIMTARYKLNEFASAYWTWQGCCVYSPLIHFHKMAKHYKMPTSFDFWNKNNYSMLRHAEKVFVLELPGWTRSIGLNAECDIANMLHIDIVNFHWEDVKDMLQLIHHRSADQDHGQLIINLSELLESQEAVDTTLAAE